MFLICSLIFATLAVTIGYFVLFAAGKAEGRLQKFGRCLAIWFFVLAAFPLLGGVYMAISGHPGVGMMRGHHGGAHGWMQGPRGEKGRAIYEERWRRHLEEMHPSK